MDTIFILDDDEDFLRIISQGIRIEIPHISVKTFSVISDFLKGLEIFKPSVCLVDLGLSSESSKVLEPSGLFCIKEIADKCPYSRIIVLTGYDPADWGIQALQKGAASYVRKPVDLKHLSALILDGLKQSNILRKFFNLEVKTNTFLEKHLVGTSLSIKELRLQIKDASLSSQFVLLTGETGTGKGYCAELIHMLSDRSKQELVYYQPNSASQDLFNSDLLGHEKGSFTGALTCRDGLIAKADKSTLLIDEFDELSISGQISLLRVVQNRSYRPVGASKEKYSNFRLICTSNSDIQDAISKGKLRSDFFFRVSGIRIHIPPLRERKADLPEIAKFLLNKITRNLNTKIRGFSEEVFLLLQSHSWPGNIRELESCIERAVHRALLNSRTFINENDISLLIQKEKNKEVTLYNAIDTNTNLSFNELVESYKENIINKAIATCSGNQSKAAKLLKLDRTTLRRILQK
jgi:DNA-binding NtrC family response regulator